MEWAFFSSLITINNNTEMINMFFTNFSLIFILEKRWHYQKILKNHFMQAKQLLSAFIFLLFAQAATAQAPNPYNSIGKASKIVTLTKGEYEEFFDEDSVQRIGSASVNVNTMKVVDIHLNKEEQRQLDNAQESRFLSVDPLTKKYPELTPYQFASNRPIDGIDLDGLEWQNLLSKFKDPGSLQIKVPNEKTAQAQHYSLTIQEPKVSFNAFKAQFKNAPQDFLTNSKATFNAPVDGKGKATEFAEGSFIKINISGPMNDGYVKVKNINEDKNGNLSATFVTLEGHVEKGIITFSISKDKDGNTKFEINSKSDVDFGMVPNSYAREKQKESWNEVLNNISKKLGGKVIEKNPNSASFPVAPPQRDVPDKTAVQPPINTPQVK